MRRLFIILWSVLPLCIWAANTLTLSMASGHPGDTLTITATLTNTDAVAAVQADIPLGQYLRFVDGSAVITSARSNGHTLYAAARNDTLHVTIFSLAGNALSGTDGALFTFRLTLGNEPATYSLMSAVTLASAAGQQLESQVTSGSVTLLSPKIQVTTAAIDYGHIPIRATYMRTLTVRNTGNEPLLITDVLFSAPEFSVAETAYTLLAGQQQNITLTFAPVLHGAIQETVRLRSNAVNDADVYDANVAVLTADPFSVNELRVQPASGISDDTVTVVLKMNNMEPIVGAQVSFKLPQQLDFIAGSATPLARSIGHQAVSTLSGDTLTLMLYSPLNQPVDSTDGDLLSFRLRLNGTSGSYALRPINTMLVNAAQQNMVSAVYQANVTIQSPTIAGNNSLEFGHIPVTTRDTAIYTVRNSGRAPLTVEGAAFLMEGFRLLTSTPLTIPTGQSAELHVEFTPSVEGNVATTMQLYSNDPATRMKSVALHASVFEPNALMITGTTVGTTYRLDIGLENYSELSGVQFDVVSASAFSSCYKDTRASAHMLSWSEVEGGRYRFVIFSMDNSLLGHSGRLLALTYDAAEAVLLNGRSIAIENATVVHTTGGAKEVTLPAPWFVEYIPNDLPTDLLPPTNANANANAKVLINGVLYILRDGKVYTTTGQEVK